MYKDMHGVASDDAINSDGEGKNLAMNEKSNKTNSGYVRVSVVDGKEAKKDSTSHGANDDNVTNFDVPSDWAFPSYMSFVLFGPFAEENDRLSIFEPSDAPKVTQPRVKKRKSDVNEKMDERNNDTNNNRGYSTDQRISIEALKLQKLNHVQTTNESNLVAFIVH